MNTRNFLKTSILASVAALFGFKAKGSITFKLPAYRYAVIEAIHKDFHLHICDIKENNREVRPEGKNMFIKEVFNSFKENGVNWRDARIIFHPDLKESFLDYIAKMC